MSQSSHSTLRLVFACLGLALGGLHTASAANDFPGGSDNFANSLEFSNSRGSVNVVLFDKTVEPNEPGHRANGENAARRSAWWRWKAPETGFCTVDTRLTVDMSNGVLGTSIAVYRGDSLTTLTRVAGNDAHSFKNFHVDADYSSVTFRAEAGVTYHIAVDAFRNGVVSTTFSNAAIQLRHVPLRKMVRRGIVRLLNDGDVFGLGSIAVTTTPTGRLTGKLITTQKSYSFTGALSRDGFFTTSFEPPAAKAGTEQEPPITLILDMAGDGFFALYHNNTVIDGQFPELTLIPANTTIPKAGYYTAHVSANDAGVGYTTFTIKGNGSVRGTGVAPDGTAFSFATSLFSQDETPTIPIHIPMHGKKGGLALDLRIIDQGDVGPEGQPRYAVRDSLGAFVRPPSSKAFYSEGVADTVNVSGGSYFTPTATELRPFGFLNPNGEGKFTLFSGSGELESNIVADITLEPSGKVVFEDTTLKPVIKLNPKTGLITGSITEPGKKKRTLRGVIAQEEFFIDCGGLTTGTTRNLDFFIHPLDF